jgi:hypothetical protein
MNDIADVTQLILHERQGRDRGWWQQMRDCFDPQASVRLSWFDGSGADFVTESEAMTGRGDKAVHRLAPPVVHLHGERAVVEVPAAIEMRVDLDGVEADLTSYTRLLYRVHKQSGSWRIASLDAIYERDTLQSATPDAPLRLDPDRLAQFRVPYRMLAYHLSSRGYPVAGDLYGDDQPERVAALYADTFAWLGR